MLQKRKKVKKVYILLLIFIIALTTCYIIFKLKPQKNEYSDNTKVLDTITQALDLNTVKYNYNNIVAVKKDLSIMDIKIPFTDKSFVIKYSGIINAGVKPEDIEVLSNKEGSISIEIKKCSILDHYIDDENLYLYDVKNSIFNKVDMQEVFEDMSKYKKEYESKVIEEGFMDEVKSNTESSLKSSLMNMGYKDVQITFK